LFGYTVAMISSRIAAIVVTRPVSMVNLVSLTSINLVFAKLDWEGRKLSIIQTVIVRSHATLLPSQVTRKASEVDSDAREEIVTQTMTVVASDIS